mgnify:CR=1 FL=1
MLAPSPPYSSLDPRPPPAPKRRLLIVLLLVAIILVIIIVIFAGGTDLGTLVATAAHAARKARHDHPLGVALCTVVAYTTWVVGFLPTTLPELALGFVFGLRIGYVIDLVGKLLAAVISYALGRTALRSCLHTLLLGSPGGDVLRVFEDEAAARPYATSFMLRAAYLPMPLKNYGLAVLGVPWVPYAVALVPLEILDTYLPVAIGASANDVAALFRGDVPEGQTREAVWAKLGLIGIAAAATFALLGALAGVTKKAVEDARRRRALNDTTADPRHDEDDGRRSGVTHAE